MSDRTGIFAGDDPFAILHGWLKEAAAGELSDPNAMSLATVGRDGMPNVRIVLLKDISDAGLVFYTNTRSRKGQELADNGKAAAALHWKSLQRQVRVRGLVKQVAAPISDAYYATRALESRIGAWASDQSTVLANRAELEARVADARKQHGDAPKRPPHWGGYVISPLEIEFWADGPYRLHDRFLWSRNDPDDEWGISRLSP